jgi:pyrroline-5-carboxylate reductase
MVIGFAGSGNMARALVLGLALEDPALFTDGGSGRAAALAAEVGGEAVGSNQELGQRAQLIFLAHKPAQLEAVAREIGSVPVVVSLLGGVTVASLGAAYPEARVVRAMPNTAVEVWRGGRRGRGAARPRRHRRAAGRAADGSRDRGQRRRARLRGADRRGVG